MELTKNFGGGLDETENVAMGLFFLTLPAISYGPSNCDTINMMFNLFDINGFCFANVYVFF